MWKQGCIPGCGGLWAFCACPPLKLLFLCEDLGLFFLTILQFVPAVSSVAWESGMLLSFKLVWPQYNNFLSLKSLLCYSPQTSLKKMNILSGLPATNRNADICQPDILFGVTKTHVAYLFICFNVFVSDSDMQEPVAFITWHHQFEVSTIFFSFLKTISRDALIWLKMKDIIADSFELTIHQRIMKSWFPQKI